MSHTLKNNPIFTSENWNKFSSVEHNTWKTLFQRQSEILKDRVVAEVFEGMNNLDICSDKIPRFSDINKILFGKTGFQIVPVTGFVAEDLYFQLLSERKFPSTCFIRKPDQLDYLEEPDMFHDIFGHVPLLANTVIANFLEEFGKKALESIEFGMLKSALALYWFTVEFGLIKTNNGLRIYGAGITSSSSESIYCLESDIPLRVKFDVHKIIKSQYKIDELQKTYFVIESFDELFEAIRNISWQKLALENIQLV